jgi:hypothetical protein
LALPTHIHCQTAEYHNRNGIRHVTAEPARCSLTNYRASRQAVETANPIVHADYISPRRSPTLIFQRLGFQPVIQRRFSTMKIRQLMSGL